MGGEVKDAPEAISGTRCRLGQTLPEGRTNRCMDYRRSPWRRCKRAGLRPGYLKRRQFLAVVTSGGTWSMNSTEPTAAALSETSRPRPFGPISG
jgi:hypothetical protein